MHLQGHVVEQASIQGPLCDNRCPQIEVRDQYVPTRLGSRVQVADITKLLRGTRKGEWGGSVFSDAAAERQVTLMTTCPSFVWKCQEVVKDQAGRAQQVLWNGQRNDAVQPNH